MVEHQFVPFSIRYACMMFHHATLKLYPMVLFRELLSVCMCGVLCVCLCLFVYNVYMSQGNLNGFYSMYNIQSTCMLTCLLHAT